MACVATVADLCSLIVRSELVAVAALDECLGRWQSTGEMPGNPSALAALAIRDNLLTSFQAKLLLQGRWKNFFLSGKYKVLEHLGSGGMGAVFLCEHRHMRRRVAVKILPPDPSDPTHVERYRARPRRSRCSIIRTSFAAFDLDRDGSLHFLVMEYVDGASLQFLVNSRGPLPVDRAVNFIAQAALGLQHASDAGLVHRDVKPSNLMLDWAGTIKLLDLGLARFARRVDNNAIVSDSKMVIGTADYLAPEQARSSTVDVRADIYALGTVAYFLLTGRPPFAGGGVAQKLIRHQTEVPKPVDAIRSEVPAGVAGVIAQMLAKEPAARPQCPAHVIADLRSWVVDVPPPTPDEMPPTRFAPGEDMDTKARHSTMALMSKSSRDMLLKTIIAAKPEAEVAES